MAKANDLPGEAAPRDVHYRSFDGLTLHAVEYGPRMSPWLPVICLPGLSRNARDFHELALHLSTHRHRPRRVIAFDYRGRGGSAFDKDQANYNPLTEMTDILDGMSALDVARAVVVGTSRGGIIAMMMGVGRPAVIAGVVLNDIGPAIEPVGLARIKSYVGRTPAPEDWSDAVAILKRLHGAQFTALGDDDWQAFARMTYREVDGRPAGDYDPALARTLDGIEFDRPLPSLWKEFATLAAVPVLAIRGENSDLLSAATLDEMGRIHAGLETITVAGEGHPPLLRHALLQRISAFVTRVEGSAPPADAIIPTTREAFDVDTAPETTPPAP
jgi:pimeloyl-ACP methyl ester carboxylesterase